MRSLLLRTANQKWCLSRTPLLLRCIVWTRGTFIYVCKHNIYLATRMANFKPVPLPTNPTDNDWAFFKARFMDLSDATDGKKKALLLVSLGHEGNEILEGLPDSKASFAECNAQLDEYFGRKSSSLLRRKTFFSARQEQNETANAFACRLRHLASDCNFGDNKSTLLRDIFVIGIFNDCLGERLLADETTLTFDLAIKKVEAFDRARQECTSSKSATISAVQHSPDRRLRKPLTASTAARRSTAPSRCCYHCGSPDHIASAADCPPAHAKCRSCDKIGRFSKVCRSTNKAAVHQLEQTSSDTTTSDGNSDYSMFATTSAATKRTVSINNTHVDILGH